ncbi:hypothetical protein ABMA32_08220 [Mesorhizobium sp. VNQ89]|uniref:hypothetical protein n=1 Tax=Mesorhizobium quangtriensis TaxID=3157709 RepID=UPI0032B813DA
MRDDNGRWHTGWLPFGELAELVGTTTSDVVRRLVVLGVLEHRDNRHRLTAVARQKGYGTTWRFKDGDRRLEWDVILPDGMVLLVQNLEATNLPLTRTEQLYRQGLSLRAIAREEGVTLKAVQKRLDSVPPRLTNWPVLGTWHNPEIADNDNTDDHRVCAA